VVFPADDLLARDLADEAGRRLLALRASANGGDGADGLRRAGDMSSQEFLAGKLASLRPHDAVLSEEAADDLGRLSADRVWIIDPLDGTREFGEPGRTDWAVHVALWERAAADASGGYGTGDGDLTCGAVALPAQGLVLSSAEPPDHKPSGNVTRPLRIVVSRTRPPEFISRLADVMGAELVPLGSAGAKAAAVITGEVDAYVHSGGQYEWDTAAPVAVARAAGLHASRIDGSPLGYNAKHPWLPDILICPVPLAGPLIDAIGTS
jgi:3'(2'), 5'-bisphosphate nucleotidase